MVGQPFFQFLEYLINLAVSAGAVDYLGGDVRLLLFLPLRLLPLQRMLPPRVSLGGYGRAQSTEGLAGAGGAVDPVLHAVYQGIHHFKLDLLE